MEKLGDPNGIIEFAGAATSMRELEEPAGTRLQELGFPVVRRSGTGIVGVQQVDTLSSLPSSTGLALVS